MKRNALVLAAALFLTTLAGAFLGRWASARVLTPVSQAAVAAADIASGNLDTRLEAGAERARVGLVTDELELAFEDDEKPPGVAVVDCDLGAGGVVLTRRDAAELLEDLLRDMRQERHGREGAGRADARERQHHQSLPPGGGCGRFCCCLRAWTFRSSRSALFSNCSAC